MATFVASSASSLPWRACSTTIGSECVQCHNKTTKAEGEGALEPCVQCLSVAYCGE